MLIFLFYFRHDRPSDPDDPLNDQNIKDRYYGSNDPVADKILKRAETLPSLHPPEDPLITTLYIGGLGDENDGNPITEQDLRNHFYQYGEIRQITVVPKQGCAFIQVSFKDQEYYLNLDEIGRKETQHVLTCFV